MKPENLPLPQPELLAILRAADDIIAEGGRTLLSKILKGSKEKKLVDLGLDRNPSFGYYRGLTLEQIMVKVDQMVHTGFLEIEMHWKLPMIVFSSRGWVVERERRAEEFLQEWNRWIENNITPASMEYLKERNRGLIFLFLYKVLCSGKQKYIPFLTQWESIDFKKVQAEIRKVIKVLRQIDVLENQEWEQLKRERAKTLLIRSSDPIIMVCLQCGNPFIFDDTNPDYYTSEGLQFPESCPNCLEKV